MPLNPGPGMAPVNPVVAIPGAGTQPNRRLNRGPAIPPANPMAVMR
jgi:hypothetical protein